MRRLTGDMSPFRYVLGKFWIWAGGFYIRGGGGCANRGKGLLTLATCADFTRGFAKTPEL